MSGIGNTALLERLLLSQLEEIEKKIAELSLERDAVKRQITKVRQRNVPLRDVTRKNSFNRIMIETKIIEALRAANKPMSAQKLFREAEDISYNLKNVTFRSQLTRMKDKGLIASAGRGMWQLADSRGAKRKP